MAPGLAFEAEAENDPMGLLRDLVQGHRESLMNSPRDLAGPLVQEELDQGPGWTRARWGNFQDGLLNGILKTDYDKNEE